MTKENKITTIDRLTGKPFSGESDQPEGWTIQSIQEKAVGMGKKFSPNPEIVNRLSGDLASGALVLFTPAEVEAQVELGNVPAKWREDLVNLTSEKGFNDVAVIPISAIETFNDSSAMLGEKSPRGNIASNMDLRVAGH